MLSQRKMVYQEKVVYFFSLEKRVCFFQTNYFKGKIKWHPSRSHQSSQECTSIYEMYQMHLW